MDRLSEQIRTLRGQWSPPVVPGRQPTEATRTQDMQFYIDKAMFETANHTRRANRQNNTIIMLLIVTAMFTALTALFTGFLAYVLYSALQALQDAANQINTTGL